MTTRSTILVLGLVAGIADVSSFTVPNAKVANNRVQSLGNVQTLFALTERQMQFWEDVDDTLNDVEVVFKSDDGQGQGIDRIRDFAKSAQGITPAPQGLAPGHQPSEENVEGLTAKPFWDVASDPINFPWAEKLEANAHIIAEEFQAKLDREQALFTGDSAWQNNVMGAGWSAFRLQRLGVWNVQNCKEFPRTYDLLKSLDIPIAVRGVCFARQAPGSGVQPHSDGRNFILTSHLGLKIPEGCWIQVGEERTSWEEGKLTTLDTSFEHSTGNPTKLDRHVLIIDFWHPDLTEAERAALEAVYDLRNKFETGQVPVRKPRSLVEAEGGLKGIFGSLFSGGEK
eukprot:CAMPEP_0203637548 /NCGR_PEP_ID=MMETSP0088-20131115/3844_1 /ASSEMBLY_ACC=CAM_ASM_001087 /TAXON_ID=426623 /ORGANISM="Chaetoceros affinis, Strain CCMP159" /LENGTH=340 /DNA_ID=CAMNT_0050492011 /DNA_START=49 /DNA_END=1071 /DNA_ORIENTATION=-